MRTTRFAMQTARHRALRSIPGVALWVVAAVVFALPGCSRDPATAPIVSRSDVVVELGLVAGILAAPSAVAGADCGTVTEGFPDDVMVRITVTPPNGNVLARELAVAAGASNAAINFEGLVPGEGYAFEARVERSRDNVLLFDGAVREQTIRPGAREVIRVPLLPRGRRGVIGIGASISANDLEQTIPVYVSNSERLRGVQFDLCFDTAMFEVVEVRGVGRAGGFDGIGGGHTAPDMPYRVVVWSTDATQRLAPGGDAIVELTVRFTAQAEPGARQSLVFADGILAESADPAQNFETYFFDGSVTR